MQENCSILIVFLIAGFIGAHCWKIPSKLNKEESMKSFVLILSALLLFPILAFGSDQTAKMPIVTYPLLTGDEIVSAPVAMPPSEELYLDEMDVIGDTFTIGTTWYENQHNGTIGRMVDKDSLGYYHFVWMNGLNSGASQRHIFYNFVTPANVQGWPGVGQQVDTGFKGGFTVVDAAFGGRAFPAFHQQLSSTDPNRTAVGGDFAPHIGAFLVYSPTPPAIPNPVIWPRMQIDRNGRIHVISTENVPAAGSPQRQYYISGTYNTGTGEIVFDPVWTNVDTTMTIAADVAVSDVSDRVAFAWTRPRAPMPYNQYNNDIYYLIDADGLNPNFSQAVNLTNFIPPNLSFLPDTARANQDTLRAYTDLNLFFDQSNCLHIVFTTRGYWQIQGTLSVNNSIIWHWSEQWPDSFRIVHNGWTTDATATVQCGAWNVKAQRPILGQDPSTGYLYCMYQVYDCDAAHLSLSGYPSGEIYVSVSTDGGMNWSVGTNVTNTITPAQATPGNSWSELTPSMAKTVDGYCRIMYVLDKDAGNVVQTEGSWTLNPVKYHRVPVSAIPTTPLVPQTIHLHVPAGNPNIDITLTPVNPPIVIPSGGGSFNFNASLINHESSVQSFSTWILVKLPNGSLYGPVLGPVPLTLPAGASITRQRTQAIPASAPAGQYYYIGYVGNYPAVKYDSSYFNFTKSADMDGGFVENWLNSGESFGSVNPAAPPVDFLLCAAHPNPFNPVTTLRYSLSEAAHVNLTIYDLQGRMVASLVDALRSAGTHEVIFDASNLPSGVYLYRLQAGGATAGGKLALLK